jgi:hypothetical protein
VEEAGGQRKLHQRKGERQGAKLTTELIVNKQRKGSKDGEWAGDKPLPKAGQVVDHGDDLLRQRAASKTQLHCKTGKQTANYNKTQTAEGSGGTLNLSQGKGAGQTTKLQVVNSQ